MKKTSVGKPVSKKLTIADLKNVKGGAAPGGVEPSIRAEDAAGNRVEVTGPVAD